MSHVTTYTFDKLPLRARMRLGVEVLGAYLRVRLTMRSGDAEEGLKRLRGAMASDAAGGAEEAMAIPAGEAQEIAAWRLAQATRKVLERLPSDSRCLFRSLTLLCMLQRRGIEQTLVIAVRTKPFGAHAWVEVNGRAVLPAADPGYERILEL